MRGEQKYCINKKYFIKARETAKELERVAGIEPARSAWEADRLPLHHTRKSRGHTDAIFNAFCQALSIQSGLKCFESFSPWA